jgi:hypothetical protein
LSASGGSGQICLTRDDERRSQCDTAERRAQPPRRKGLPSLVERAGADAGTLQGWIPDPPPEGIDVDGPAFLIQKDIIASQPRLRAVVLRKNSILIPLDVASPNDDNS